MAEINPVHRQLCLPRIYREEIANGHHADNSHIGFDRLFASVKQKYYWPLMYSQLRELVLGCQDCQQAKKQTKEKKAPMRPLPVVPIFERIHCDLLGPVTKSVDGYQYILLVVDSFSRFPEAFPLKTQKAEEVAEALYSVICRWGAPTSILSDNGRNFVSKLCKVLFDLFKIKHLRTSAYHPQCNSACENINRTILQSFRLYCSKAQEKWPSVLNPLLYSYRATTSVKSTQSSPFEILFS